MALLPSGSSEIEIISISTPYFDFYLKGKVKYPAACTEEDEALYEVKCEEPAELIIADLIQVEAKALKIMGDPKFFEQTVYQLIIEKKKECQLQFDHDSPLIRQSVTSIGKMNHLLAGVLQFGNEVGLTELRVLVNGQIYLRLIIEIYPTKLSYKADYLKIREDIAREIYNLTFDFMKRTYSNASLSNQNSSSLTEFFSLFKEKGKELIRVTDLIIKNPHHKLIEEGIVESYRQGQAVGTKGINYLNKHPQQVVRQGQSYVPRKVLQIKKQMTVDVYENQVIKYMLIQVIYQLKRLEKQYMKLERQKDEVFLIELRKWVHALEQRLNGFLFKKVSKLNRTLEFSIVLQMSPVYSSFYKLYLLLQKGLSITSDIFQISQKDVAQLYEYWCFIKLGSLLKQNHELVSSDVIRVKHHELYVSLQKGKDSTLRFRNRQTGELMTLVYNQKLRSMPTVAQAPDNMLILEKRMSDVTYHYVLDAKYKMNYEKIDQKLIEVPKEEDINTMHRYRDAIVAQSNANIYERKIFESIILFPGNHVKEYQKHRFYKSIQSVGIGGLPFLPSHSNLVEEFLEKLIEGTERAPYQTVPKIAGWQTYTRELDLTTQDVLLGPIKSKEQLDIVLKEKIYYVPAKRINLLNKQIKKVALYEPKGIGTLRTGGIAYIGEITSVEMQPRKVLNPIFGVHDGNNEEDYILFHIYEWKYREEPIIPCGYGVRSPWYSNQTLLKYAKTLPELHIKNEMELELILQLRRNMKQAEIRLDEQEKVVIEVEGSRVYISEDEQIIVEKGEERKTFAKEMLDYTPRQIYQYLSK